MSGPSEFFVILDYGRRAGWIATLHHTIATRGNATIQLHFIAFMDYVDYAEISCLILAKNKFMTTIN